MARRPKTDCEKTGKVDVVDVACDLMLDSMSKLLARAEQDEAYVLDLVRLVDERVVGEGDPILAPAGHEKQLRACAHAERKAGGGRNCARARCEGRHVQRMRPCARAAYCSSRRAGRSLRDRPPPWPKDRRRGRCLREVQAARPDGAHIPQSTPGVQRCTRRRAAAYSQCSPREAQRPRAAAAMAKTCARRTIRATLAGPGTQSCTCSALYLPRTAQSSEKPQLLLSARCPGSPKVIAGRRHGPKMFLLRDLCKMSELEAAKLETFLILRLEHGRLLIVLRAPTVRVLPPEAQTFFSRAPTPRPPCRAQKRSHRVPAVRTDYAPLHAHNTLPAFPARALRADLAPALLRLPKRASRERAHAHAQPPSKRSYASADVPPVLPHQPGNPARPITPSPPRAPKPCLPGPASPSPSC